MAPNSRWFWASPNSTAQVLGSAPPPSSPPLQAPLPSSPLHAAAAHSQHHPHSLPSTPAQTSPDSKTHAQAPEQGPRPKNLPLAGAPIYLFTFPPSHTFFFFPLPLPLLIPFLCDRLTLPLFTFVSLQFPIIKPFCIISYLYPPAASWPVVTTPRQPPLYTTYTCKRPQLAITTTTITLQTVHIARMTSAIAARVDPLEMAMPPAADIDMRGRKRHRSPTRPEIRALRTEESSTLRGRSRHRSESPHRSQNRSGARSRASSPARLTSNALRLAYHARQREARRDHCPSRASSPRPVETARRQQRTKSRNKPALAELQKMTAAAAS